jgi:hypothetical protein
MLTSHSCSLHSCSISGFVSVNVYAELFEIWACRFHQLYITTPSTTICSNCMYPVLGQGINWYLQFLVHI